MAAIHADYIKLAFTDFIELHGDRAYRDDAAIIVAGRVSTIHLMVIGHKWPRHKEQLKRNFGMPHPRLSQALRLMKLAKIPRAVLPSSTRRCMGRAGREEPRSVGAMRETCMRWSASRFRHRDLIGEGGSGGAWLWVSRPILMMETAVYSVISVEGCAAIL